MQESGLIPTPMEGQRHYWLLRHESAEITAVEYETGLEILIVDLAVNIAAAAIVGVTVWGWKKWRASRAKGTASGKKVESSLVLDSVKERSSDGRNRITNRLEIRGPLEEEEVESAIRAHLQGVTATH